MFVTGYGAESIDERFADVPVLQKPIERETLQRIFVNGTAGAADSPPARRRHRQRRRQAVTA